MNKVVLGDGTDMTSHLSADSVDLIVTSPPSVLQEKGGLDEYLEFLGYVWRGCRRVLTDSGTLCIIAGGVQVEEYVPLHFHIELQLLQCGWQSQRTIIWVIPASGEPSAGERNPDTASSSEIREIHKHILVFSKQEGVSVRRESELSEDELAQLEASIWTVPAPAVDTDHSRVFPEEIPSRLIKLYTSLNDLVLDPFVRTGTTCVAAKRLGRKWFGLDSNPDHVLTAHERIQSTPERC